MGWKNGGWVGREGGEREDDAALGKRIEEGPGAEVVTFLEKTRH